MLGVKSPVEVRSISKPTDEQSPRTLGDQGTIALSCCDMQAVDPRKGDTGGSYYYLR